MSALLFWDAFGCESESEHLQGTHGTMKMERRTLHIARAHFWLRSGALPILSIAAFLAISVHAQAAIYWAGDGSIGRANLDGSLLEPGFISQTGDGLGDDAWCADVATSSSQVFWTNPNAGTVGRANLDGSDATHAFISGASNPCGLALNGTHIFWVNQHGNSIGRANLDGTEVDQHFIEGVSDACGIAASDTFLYWSNWKLDLIKRALLPLGIVGPMIQGHDLGINSVCGLAVNASHLYWGSFSQDLGRTSLDGSTLEPRFISGVERPCDIALDGSHVYWSEDWGDGAIGSASLDGTGINRSVVPDLWHPCGIAVDSVTLYPSLEESRAFVFGDTRYKKRKGIAFMSVYTPGQGELRVDTEGVSWRIISEPLPDEVSRGFLGWIRIRPGTGDEGNRLRRQLKREGRASLEISVTYQEHGKKPTTAAKRLTLRRKPPRKKRSALHRRAERMVVAPAFSMGRLWG